MTDGEAAVIHGRIDDEVKALGYWDDDLSAHWWRDDPRQRYEQAVRRTAS